MSRLLCAMLMVLGLAACGGGGNIPARNLDNACVLLKQNRSFKRAFVAAKRKWGVPIHVQMATMHQESKFRKNAKTPMRYTLGIIPRGRQSSAYGYAQALDGTWNTYRRATGRFGARRNNIRDAADFMGWYMTTSREKNGISLSNAKHQYLAYHEGQTGYSRGTYRRKKWLMSVSNRVQQRANMYETQLKRCPRMTR